MKIHYHTNLLKDVHVAKVPLRKDAVRLVQPKSVRISINKIKPLIRFSGESGKEFHYNMMNQLGTFLKGYVLNVEKCGVRLSLYIKNIQ